MITAVKGTIYPISSAPIADGVLIYDGGKISAVGNARELKIPAGAQVIDATGKVILPGLVDAHTHAGLWSEWYGSAENDGNEGGDPVTPDVRAIDAVWPAHSSFLDARSGGTTTIQTTPGSGNSIGGEMLCVKTIGNTIEEMIVRCPTGMKAALGENPKRWYGETFKKAPSTRMGNAAVIRKAFYKALDYMRKLDAGKVDASKMPDTDIGLQGLIKVLRKELPLRIHAHRADDIVTAVRLAEEFGIDYSIEHCTDGATVAEFLGQRAARVNLGPTFGSKTKNETKNLSFANAKVLAEAGCKVSIITDHPFVAIQHLMTCAALTCGAGLDEVTALRAVTLTPAETIGVADRVGSLDAGKDADFVIWTGHPFKVRSRVEKVFIDGKLALEQ
jgi:imidazolonepropionase-like amidohydrolase